MPAAFVEIEQLSGVGLYKVYLTPEEQAAELTLAQFLVAHDKSVHVWPLTCGCVWEPEAFVGPALCQYHATKMRREIEQFCPGWRRSLPKLARFLRWWIGRELRPFVLRKLQRRVTALMLLPSP